MCEYVSGYVVLTILVVEEKLKSCQAKEGSTRCFWMVDSLLASDEKLLILIWLCHTFIVKQRAEGLQLSHKLLLHMFWIFPNKFRAINTVVEFIVIF